jgi:hypothetical protein
MGGVLAVDPAGYLAAGSTVGNSAAGAVQDAAQALTAGLSGLASMAGSDAAARGWAASYDEAARAALGGAQDALNAALQLADLLERTGINYATAEADSPGRTTAAVPTGLAYGGRSVFLGALPSAAGGSGGGPAGWGLVAHLVGYAWPNGHQDRLHRAAATWHESACGLYDASHLVADAVYAVAQQASPDTDTAIDVCNGLRDTLERLAELFKALGMHCAEFAGFLDHAHAQVEHELTTLLAWTAAVESGGALLSVVSFGVAEAPTQVAEAARIAATAARVGAILARLAGLAHDGAAAIGRLAPRFAELSRSLRPLLSARAVTAETRSVVLSTAEELRSVSAAERLATVPKSPGFGSARSLTQHFAEHGNDFGCASAAEYDAAAREFLERARRLGLPTKVDSDGIVRVFEPGTNTFAAYNADGTVRTFFKPSSATYWSRQPGR